MKKIILTLCLLIGVQTENKCFFKNLMNVQDVRCNFVDQIGDKNDIKYFLDKFDQGRYFGELFNTLSPLSDAPIEKETNFNCICNSDIKKLTNGNGELFDFISFSCENGNPCVRKSKTECEPVDKLYYCHEIFNHPRSCIVFSLHAPYPNVLHESYSYNRYLKLNEKIIKHELSRDKQKIRLHVAQCKKNGLTDIISEQILLKINGTKATCADDQSLLKKDNLYFKNMPIDLDYSTHVTLYNGKRMFVNGLFKCVDETFLMVQKVGITGTPINKTVEKITPEIPLDDGDSFLKVEENTIINYNCAISGKKLLLKVTGNNQLQTTKGPVVTVDADNVETICSFFCKYNVPNIPNGDLIFNESMMWSCPGNKVANLPEKSGNVTYATLSLSCLDGFAHYTKNESLTLLPPGMTCINSNNCILKPTDSLFDFVSTTKDVTVINKGEIYVFECSLNVERLYNFHCSDPDGADQETWKKLVENYCQTCPTKGFAGKGIVKYKNEDKYSDDMTEFVPGNTKLACNGTDDMRIRVGDVLSDFEQILCVDRELRPWPSRFSCASNASSCFLKQWKEFEVDFHVNGSLVNEKEIVLICNKSKKRIILICNNGNLYIKKDDKKLVLFVEGTACYKARALQNKAWGYLTIFLLFLASH